MSNGPRVLIIINHLSLLSLVYFGKSIVFPLPTFKLLMKTRGCGVKVLVNEVWSPQQCSYHSPFWSISYSQRYFFPDYGALIPFPLLPHICVGGLDHSDIWCTSDIFGTTRLFRHSSSSIALPYSRSRYNSNSADIKGPDSVQYFTFQSRRRDLIRTVPYFTISATMVHKYNRKWWII